MNNYPNVRIEFRAGADGEHKNAGIAMAITFVRWADARRNIGWCDVVDRFGVSRATAYRWLKEYATAEIRA